MSGFSFRLYRSFLVQRPCHEGAILGRVSAFCIATIGLTRNSARFGLVRYPAWNLALTVVIVAWSFQANQEQAARTTAWRLLTIVALASVANGKSGSCSKVLLTPSLSLSHSSSRLSTSFYTSNFALCPDLSLKIFNHTQLVILLIQFLPRFLGVPGFSSVVNDLAPSPISSHFASFRIASQHSLSPSEGFQPDLPFQGSPIA